MRRLLPLLLLISCVAPPNAAEIATYKAIAPEYRAYVVADPALTEPDRTLRLNTLLRWAEALQIPEEDR